MDWSLTDVAEAFGIAESVLTSLGIIVAGVWTYFLFIRQRLLNPRLNISHSISTSQLENGSTLLHIQVQLENAGQVMVSVTRVDTWVQQILPLLSHAESALEDHDPVATEGPREIEWPLVGDRSEEVEIEIESGETDFIEYDFVLPGTIQELQVYTYIPNSKKEEQGLGWPATRRFSVEEGEAKYTSVRRLPEGESTMPDEKKRRPPKRVDEQGPPKKKPPRPQQPKKEKPRKEDSGSKGGRNG